MHDMGRVGQGRAWRGMDLKPRIYPPSCRLIPAADGPFRRALGIYSTRLAAQQCSSLDYGRLLVASSGTMRSRGQVVGQAHSAH